MARKLISFEEGRTRKGNPPSAAEQAERVHLEALADHPFDDDEWRRQSQRLREYVAILLRWDAELRIAGECAKMDSKAVA